MASPPTVVAPPDAPRPRPVEPRRSVRRVPAWAWLVALVAASVLVRYAFGRRIVAPWIMVDELVYSELAKGLAESGRLAIRDEPASGAFGVLYPLLLAPAYLVHESLPAAYGLAKAINGLLFSLAAVPTYLLARRLVSVPYALAAAVLAVAVPGALYSGMIMTENVFYPLVATTALALVLALERPTPLRVALLLGAVGIAFLARAQAVVLVPAILAAPLVLAAFERRPRALLRFRWLYGLTGGAAALVLAAQAVRGRSPLDLLGAYRVVGEQEYDLGLAARWALYHVAQLDLSLGVLPFAALLLLVGLAPRLGPREQAFVAVACTLSVLLVLQVAVFASRFAHRIEERNMFHLAPLFLVALVLWVERGMPRPRAPAAAVAAAAAFLPLVLPFEALVNVTATSDTFGLLLWWDVVTWGVPLEQVWQPAAALALALALVFLLLPRRLGPAVPVLVLAFFAVSTYSAEHWVRTASVGSLFQGITHPQRDWVDRAAGPDAEVAALWSSRRDWLTVVQNEFFSRSVRRVYTLDAPMPAALPQTALAADYDTGLLRGPDEEEVRAEYALADDRLALAGTLVASDETKGMRLVRPDGPLHLRYATRGLYEDTWSEPEFEYRRYDCAGGSVRVALEQDQNLVDGAQRVVARSTTGRVLARFTVRPGGENQTMTVPLPPPDERACTVRFSVSPTAVPADVRRGSTDTRELGIRVLAFDQRP